MQAREPKANNNKCSLQFWRRECKRHFKGEDEKTCPIEEERKKLKNDS